MKIINLLRYIKGFVVFQAVGGFCERFINLCARNSIIIFNTSYIDGSFTAQVDLKSFKKLRPIARKTGVKIVVKEKTGLLFSAKENSHRAGLVAGFFIYFIFVFALNIFVWNIEASGSVRYSSEQLIEAAEKAGVKYGISRFFFDEGEAARQIYKQFNDELSWVTVNIKGSKCFIEARDSDKRNEENTESKEPSNLLADFDGVILSDETYSGVKNISKGNAVKKGDLLISGILENEDGSAIYYSAKGRFTALHKREIETALNIRQNCERYTSCDKRYIFHIFGLSLPFYSDTDRVKSDVFRRDVYIQFDRHMLPLGVSVIYIAHYDKSQPSEKDISMFAADEYTEKTYDEFKNTNLMSSEISFIKENKVFKIIGEYDCIDFIGESKPIIIENIKTQ